MNRKTLSQIAAAVAALSIAGAACAASPADALSTRVRYADLNLSNDIGVAHLYARLRHAASEVCQYASFRDAVDQNCAARALDTAVASVASERLTAMHERAAGGQQAAANRG